MDIIHISDLHFGHPQPSIDWTAATESLVEFVNERCGKNRILVLSGDITFQGQVAGYEEARHYLSRLAKAFERSNILVCPGNHDLDVKNSASAFKALDAFTSWIRNDNVLSFNDRSIAFYEYGDTFFTLLNSAYHRNHEYGLIDVESLNRVLRENSERLRGFGRRIAITHHHFIGQFTHDTSSIRNAHEVLKLFDLYGFTAVLHGHQHAHRDLSMGKSQVRLLGISSAGFRENHHVNGFCHHKCDSTSIVARRYVFSSDGCIPTSVPRPYILQVATSDMDY